MSQRTNPATEFFAITPSNSTASNRKSTGLYVGVGGNVVAVSHKGSAITFKNVPAGMTLPIEIVRVNATGTTATDLVGFEFKG